MSVECPVLSVVNYGHSWSEQFSTITIWWRISVVETSGTLLEYLSWLRNATFNRRIVDRFLFNRNHFFPISKNNEGRFSLWQKIAFWCLFCYRWTIAFRFCNMQLPLNSLWKECLKSEFKEKLEQYPCKLTHKI